MDDKYLFNIRVTGILVENGHLLLVRQSIAPNRDWSLPGGRVEAGEALDTALIREIFEETGLIVETEKLLYVSEKTDVSPSILHITFLLKKVGGLLTLPTNEHDENPISDVKMVGLENLVEYGFSEKFALILSSDFSDSGSYVGSKSNIGL